MDQNLEEHKMNWVECELKKGPLKDQLKQLNKEQRVSLKILKEYMTSNDIPELDCGDGFSISYEPVEKVHYSEKVCGKYMNEDQLRLLKKENTKRSNRFKVSVPN